MGETTEAQREALASERDVALGSLAELDRELAAGLLQPEEYEALAAAAAQRAEVASSALAELEGKAPGPQRPSGQSLRRRRWLLGAGVLALVAAAGAALGAFAKPLLPGQTITGTEQVSSAQQLAQQLVQGRILLSEGKDVLALRLFRRILTRYPNQPEALAYQGWILASAGMQRSDPALVAKGRSYISQAIKVAPTYPDAHLLLAEVLHYALHDERDARIQARLFLADRPSAALVAGAAPLLRALGVSPGS